ncbi:MAG: hypothetical protein IPK87_12675 [Planctomycetes bacterium]|nr:hypothetical protein [Planctomycetota bacterium]
MEGDKENCTTCGPNGLKFSRRNGRGRVEVPEHFLADKLGSIDAQIAEGMAMAERLAAARQKRDSAPAAHPSQSYQPQGPSAPMRPAGNFIFDPLTMTAENQQSVPSSDTPRPRNNQFTLAETEHASLLGIGPPPGLPTTIQFTLAESGAADVFPSVVQTGSIPDVQQLLSIGYGHIPGFPDKYKPILPQEVFDYLGALWRVLQILNGEWRKYGFPFFGGPTAGLIQGWTYFVDPDGNIDLRPWTGEDLDPTTSETPLCKIYYDDFDPLRHQVLRTDDSESPDVFCLGVHHDVSKADEQQKGPNGEVIGNGFKYVAACGKDAAIIRTGFCNGPCPPETPTCRVQYQMKRWVSAAGTDILREIYPPTSAPPYWADYQAAATLWHGTRWATAEFATGVKCTCV